MQLGSGVCAVAYGKWWRWVSSVPTKDNLGANDSGKNCAAGQNNPNLWFLAGIRGGEVNRACTIPGGKTYSFQILM